MKKELKSSLIVLISVLLLICGCKRQPVASSTNHSVEEECQDSIAFLDDFKSQSSHNVVSQHDTTISNYMAIDSMPQYYDTFVKLEVNKEKGYEVRRINELTFVNSSALDTILLAIRDMSPFGKYKNAIIVVESSNRITLEKDGYEPRLVVEGDNNTIIYRFGYILIDSVFIEVMGLESEAKEYAERIFRKTGRTHDYKYKYSYHGISDDKYYRYEITDSTIILIDKYKW